MNSLQINPDIFRAYDIRGIVGKDLNPEIIEVLARAYGTWLARRRVKEVVVGADVRPTSEEYKEIVVKSLADCGLRVIDIGVALSAMVYWAQYEFKANGAVMVTASHNSLEYNGLKLASGFSKGLISEEVQEIRQIAKEGKFASGEGEISKANIKEKYFRDLVRRVNLKREIKVAVDTANGTPGLFAKDLLEMAGAKVVEYHTDIDQTMPLGTPDPTDESYLTRLSYEANNSEAELGIAFDTDGDRFGVVDEKGNFVWNDVILAILAKDILERIPGATIVFNTLCSRTVAETIAKYDGRGVIAVTGHSFVEQKMTETGAVLGGELSGHFFFADNFYGFDDGFFSVLRLLDYLSRQNNTLSQIVAQLPTYISSPEIKLQVSGDNIKGETVESLASLIRKEYPVGKYLYLDGIRVDLEDSMLIVRASQNGPYLTVRFESKTPEKYSQLAKFLRRILSQNKEINLQKGVNTETLENKNQT